MQRTEAWFQVDQIYHMQRTEAWFQGEHDRYDFSVASVCFHQCQRGRLLIKVGCHLLDAEDRGMVPGGADLSDAEDRRMVPGGADLSNAEDKGMVPGGA